MGKPSIENLRIVNEQTNLCLIQLDKTKDDWKLFRITVRDRKNHICDFYDGENYIYLSAQYYLKNGQMKYVEDDGTKLIIPGRQNLQEDIPNVSENGEECKTALSEEVGIKTEGNRLHVDVNDLIREQYGKDMSVYYASTGEEFLEMIRFQCK